MYTNFRADELCDEFPDKLTVCTCYYWLYIFVMSVYAALFWWKKFKYCVVGIP